MFSSKKILISSLFLLSIATFVLLKNKSNVQITSHLITDDLKSENKPESNNSPQDNVQKAETQTTPINENSSLPLPDQEFKKWIDEEAKNLENPNQKSEDEVKTQLQVQTKRLSQAQLNDLKNIIDNSNEAINKRIFSNFVLINSNQDFSTQLLNELIEKNTDDIKQAKAPHSLDELKRSQEYALKFMQIDEIVNRLIKSESGPLDYLIGLSQKTNDTQVKTYALQKIKSLKSN